MQSMSNIAKKHSEELQLCKEKVSSLEEQNCQLDLQGSKVKFMLLVADCSLKSKQCKIVTPNM